MPAATRSEAERPAPDGVLAGWWRREVAPALSSITPAAGLVLIFGIAVLANKRYLADTSIVPLVPLRWQALAAWLAATLGLLLCLQLTRSRRRGGTVGFVLGLFALTGALAVDGLVDGPLRVAPPWRAETLQIWVMLLLVWLPAAPALAGAWHPGRRWRGIGLTALALFAVGGLLLAPGPVRPLLADHRYNTYNWGLLTFAWLLVVPLGASWGTAGGRLRDDGCGLGRPRFWVPWVVIFLGFMIAAIVIFAGRRPEFTNYYPMNRYDWWDYQPSVHGWGFFVWYEATYLFYFLGWEFFFRGWMLFRLLPDHGPRAILIQAAPFVMLHIGKPALEFHSSLIAGLLLGWLAWRSRSFWPCFLLHGGAALTMDITALVHGLRPAGG